MKKYRITISIVLIINLLFYSCCKDGDQNDGDLQECNRAGVQVGDTLYVYDGSTATPDYIWVPSGWRPDGEGMFYNISKEQLRSGSKACVKTGFVTSKLTENWGEIAWIACDDTNFKVDITDRLGLTAQSKLKITFWLRGKEGGEMVKFKSFGAKNGSINHSIATPRPIRLDTVWNQYEIDFGSRSVEDFTAVIEAFAWTAKVAENSGKDSLIFFLDDIKFQKY